MVFLFYAQRSSVEEELDNKDCCKNFNSKVCLLRVKRKGGLESNKPRKSAGKSLLLPDAISWMNYEAPQSLSPVTEKQLIPNSHNKT